MHIPQQGLGIWKGYEGTSHPRQCQIPSARQTRPGAKVLDAQSIFIGLNYRGNRAIRILVNKNDLAPNVSKLIDYGYKKALEFLGPASHQHARSEY